jgi:hypothetical protein
MRALTAPTHEQPAFARAFTQIADFNGLTFF